MQPTIFSTDFSTVPDINHAAAQGYLMALSDLSGVGPRSIIKLLDAVGGCPEKVWEATEPLLKTHLAKTEKKNFLEARARREAQAPLDPVALRERYRTLNINVMTILDADYPPLLKEIYDPPVVLYIRGNRKALGYPSLAVVGNRKISDYGRTVTQKLVADLVQCSAPLCIISGLADGVDGEAHRAALHYKLPTVAVFGCGIDMIFPAAHQPLAQAILEASGALVSEYPLGYPGSKQTFPQRNRIVAGLAQGVLVVEGSERSGSLITARLAAEENRTVFTVPGNIFAAGSQGPLKLLRQGAVPISHGQQILEELRWLPDTASASPINQTEKFETGKSNVAPGQSFEPDLSDLSAEERQLFQALPSDPTQSLSVEELAEVLGWTAAQLTEATSLLELSGLIRALPGARVARSG